MIYINDQLLTADMNQGDMSDMVKLHLHENRLVLVNGEGQPMSEDEVNVVLDNQNGILKLKAVSTSSLLRDLKLELQLYNQNVEEYVERIRENEDFSTINIGFTQVVEAVLEFSAVETFLQKVLIDSSYIHQLSAKALKGTETGDGEYILDIIEYELLPILHQLYEEINEEM